MSEKRRDAQPSSAIRCLELEGDHDFERGRHWGRYYRSEARALRITLPLAEARAA